MAGSDDDLRFDSLDYPGCILDEVALEGLDGLTIEGLWSRLSTRKPAFAFPIDPHSKEFLWSIARSLRAIDFLCLREPRPPLQIFHRFAPKYIDPETGLITDDEDRQNLYPYKLVEDGHTRGSCATYTSRTLVPEDIRNMPLAAAQRKYGNKLVMVANQRARDIAITGNHPIPITLSGTQYAMLERIGRERWNGETTQGNLGLIKIMDINAKSMYHVRKQLLKYRLMIKQEFSIRSKKGVNVGGRLLHLPRFYFQYLPKAERCIRAIADILRNLPKHRMPMDELFKRLGYTSQSMKKTIKSASFKKHLKLSVVPYREFFPDAVKSEYMTKGMNAERKIKLLEMILDPADETADDEDEDKEADGDDDDEVPGLDGHLDKSNFVPNRHLQDQIMAFAESKGSEGASMSQIEQHLGISKLDVRCVIRKLHKRNDLIAVAVSRGRQKLNKYVSKYYLEDTTTDERDGELKMRTHEFELLRELIESQKAVIAAAAAEAQQPPSEADDCVDPLENGNSSYLAEDEDEMGETITPDVIMSPELKPHGLLNIRVQNIVEDRLEVVIERNESSPKNNDDDAKNRLLSNHMTGLSLRRARQILEYLYAKKLVPLYFVHKWLRNREQEDGSMQTVDRKSLLSLLAKMEREGLIRCLKTTYEWLSHARQCTFVVHASFPTDARSVEERLNAEDLAMDSSLLRGMDGDANAGLMPDGLTEYWALKGALMGAKVREPGAILDPGYMDYGGVGRGPGKKFTGTVPKFQRSFMVHELGFYMTRGYEGNPNLDQEAAWAAINREIRAIHGARWMLTEEDIALMPRLYKKEVSWKMFIAPMHPHPSWLTKDGSPVPRGWFMLCELLVRLPLSRALQIINVRLPTFESDYLTHPVKRFVPVMRCDDAIRTHILQGRVHIQRMAETLAIVTAMGLIQIGKRLTRQSETNFYYVNTRAMIVDTRSAKECYNQIASTDGFQRRSYHFTDITKLEEFWTDLQIISLDTKMGATGAKDDDSKNVQTLTKNAGMREVFVPVEFCEAPRKDLGKIPGNAKGASGLDSSMFAHLLRSWFAPEGREPLIQEVTVLTSKSDSRTLSSRPPELLEDAPLPTTRRRRKLESSAEQLEEVEAKSPPKKKRKPGSKKVNSVSFDLAGLQDMAEEAAAEAEGRENPPAKKKFGGKSSVTRYEDETDRLILQRSVSRRAKWTPKETSIMTMCKAAVDLITQDLRKSLADQSLNAIACRDVLQKYVPDSDKTVPPIFRWFRSLRKKTRVMETAMIYEAFLRRCSEARLLLDQVAPINHWEEGRKAVAQLLEPLVQILYQEFVMNPDGDSEFSFDLPREPLPASIEDFMKEYVVHEFTAKKGMQPTPDFGKTAEVTNRQDVQMATASGILMSSLCSRTDKRNWTVHLFKIYSDFAPMLLRKVLLKFQQLRICARIKFKRRVSKRISVMQLPLTASSYRLSNRFNDKFRVIPFRFELYNEVDEALVTLLRSTMEGNGFDVTPFSHGGLSAVVTALSSAGLVNLTAELPDRDVVTYEKVNVPGAQDDDEDFPDLRNFNPVVNEDPLAVDAPNVGDASSASASDTPDRDGATTSSQQSGGDPSTPPPSSSSSSRPDGSGDTPGKKSQKQKVKPTGASHRRRVQASLPPDPEDTQFRVPRTVKVHVSRITVCLNSSLDVEVNVENPRMNFDVFVPVVARNSVLALHESYIRNETFTLEDLFAACRSENISEHDISRMQDVMDVVGEAGVVGLPIESIKAKLVFKGQLQLPPPPAPPDAESETESGSGSPPPAPPPPPPPPPLRLGILIRLLRSYQQLWAVGSHDLRYVTAAYADPWLVRTFRLTRHERENFGSVLQEFKNLTADVESEGGGAAAGERADDDDKTFADRAGSKDIHTLTEKVVSKAQQFSVRIFPWTHVDGSLNRRVLDRLLGSVLALLEENPGQTARCVARHFDPYLTPRQTYELLDILDRLGCVRTIVISPAPPDGNIFSPIEECSWQLDDCLEDVDVENIVYEPTIDAFVRLGAFIGQKEYSKNFLSADQKA